MAFVPHHPFPVQILSNIPNEHPPEGVAKNTRHSKVGRLAEEHRPSRVYHKGFPGEILAQVMRRPVSLLLVKNLSLL